MGEVFRYQLPDAGNLGASFAALGQQAGNAIDDYRIRNALKDFNGDYNAAATALLRMGKVDEAAKLLHAGGQDQYGLNPILTTDDQGNLHAWQANNKGGASELSFGGQTPTQPIHYGNTGTDLVPLGGRTPGPVGAPVPINNAQKAADQATGAAEGAATGNLSKTLDDANTALKYIDQIQARVPTTGALGDNFASAEVASVRKGMRGTEAYGFQKRVDQLKGGAFLQAFNTLKGGGQISNVEGEKATDALARMDTANNRQEFNAALDDFKAIIKIGADRAKQQAAGNFGAVSSQGPMQGRSFVQPTVSDTGLPGDQPIPGAENVTANPNGAYTGPYPDGTVITNGKERLVRQNGKWVPLQ